jgi:hypothetical protein
MTDKTEMTEGSKLIVQSFKKLTEMTENSETTDM